MKVTNLVNWLASRARTERCTTIVLHSTDGASAGSSISWLRKIGLSYNYVIERDGQITKCVPLSRYAFHAGNSYGPHEERKGVSRRQDRHGNFVAGCSVNSYSVGISFANYESRGEPLTDAQLDACAWLVKVIADSSDDIRWLTTHAFVSPGRKKDPRWLSAANLLAIAKHAGLVVWGVK